MHRREFLRTAAVSTVAASLPVIVLADEPKAKPVTYKCPVSGQLYIFDDVGIPSCPQHNVQHLIKQQ